MNVSKKYSWKAVNWLRLRGVHKEDYWNSIFPNAAQPQTNCCEYNTTTDESSSHKVGYTPVSDTYRGF